MQLLDAIILGLVQGLTEFIPVSSSGHLIVVGHFLGFEHSGLAFDTALDIGTLAALVIFFWKDLWGLARGLFTGGPERRLAIYIILATIPGVIAGVLIQDLAETSFRSSALVAINLIWVAIVMLVIDKYSSQERQLEGLTLPRALSIGVAQAIALVPGVSRSGITITAGRLNGMNRVAATRFSFLLSAPIIAGATAKVLASGTTAADMASAPGLYAAGILAAFASGLFAIGFMLRYLARHGLAVFAYYRIAMGILILALVSGGWLS